MPYHHFQLLRLTRRLRKNPRARPQPLEPGVHGTKILYVGTYDQWCPHPEGVVIVKNNQVLLNGAKLIYEGETGRLFPNPRGILIPKGDEVLFYQ